MDKKFPWPEFNKIIEPNTDKQLKTIDLETVSIGGRKVSQTKDIPNTPIKHIKNEG